MSGNDARTGQQTLASWSQITKFSPNFILVHLSLIAEQCQPRIIKQQLNSSSAEHVMSQHIVMLTRSDGVRGGGVTHSSTFTKRDGRPGNLPRDKV